VYFDPVYDYAPVDAQFAFTGAQALQMLAEQWDEPFQIVVRAETDREFAVVASMIERIQREPGADPIAVIFEETGVYGGTTYTVPDPLSRLYRLGRRWRVNCVAVTQVDSDLHRVYRYCTQVWVALRSLKLSLDLSRWFDSDRVAALETLVPGASAESGRHYLTMPETDLFGEWSKAVNP
jgi:hypothetical protein